jgi:hypothetical protein
LSAPVNDRLLLPNKLPYQNHTRKFQDNYEDKELGQTGPVEQITNSYRYMKNLDSTIDLEEKKIIVILFLANFSQSLRTVAVIDGRHHGSLQSLLHESPLHEFLQKSEMHGEACSVS